MRTITDQRLELHALGFKTEIVRVPSETCAIALVTPPGAEGKPIANPVDLTLPWPMLLMQLSAGLEDALGPSWGRMEVPCYMVFTDREDQKPKLRLVQGGASDQAS